MTRLSSRPAHRRKRPPDRRRRTSPPTRPRPPSPARATPRARLPQRPTTTGAKRGKPVSVAVTGGIGAGKSEALAAFARHGAAAISSDEIVHRLLREDAEVKSAVVERFGAGVLGPDEEIDRERVGEIAFGDPGQLAWLEALLHPRVSDAYLRWRDELARLADPPAVCATEVPLLYEVGADDQFDVVVVVTASPEVRISRHIQPVHDRERRLLPDEEKAARADFVYRNEGSLQELDRFVSDVLSILAA